MSLTSSIILMGSRASLRPILSFETDLLVMNRHLKDASVPVTDSSLFRKFFLFWNTTASLKLSDNSIKSSNTVNTIQYNTIYISQTNISFIFTIFENFKLLGVEIDSNLVCKKANQKLHALARISTFMDLNQKRLLETI